MIAKFKFLVTNGNNTYIEKFCHHRRSRQVSLAVTLKEQ